MKKLSPFDFLNSINDGSGKLFASYPTNEDGLNHESPARAYVPYVINRSLSYFQDTVLVANEMNRYANLAPKMQYDFLCGMIRPRKRFSKWNKGKDYTPELNAIIQRYGYSLTRAQEALNILTAEQIQLLLKSVDHGGKK